MAAKDWGCTHYKGCWRDPAHHACAVAEVERLQKDVVHWREARRLAIQGGEMLKAQAEAAAPPYEPSETEVEAVARLLAQTDGYNSRTHPPLSEARKMGRYVDAARACLIAADKVRRGS